MSDKSQGDDKKNKVSDSDQNPIADMEETYLSSEAETQLYQAPATGVDDEKTELYTGVVSSNTEAAGDTIAKMRPGYMLKERFELGEKLGQGGMGAVF